MIDKDIKTYLDNIGKYLVCTKKQKKIILENIETSVRDYVENANVNDISEIVSRFGSPEDIAKSYLAEFVKPADVRKALNKKKVLVAGVVIALVIWLIVGFFAWFDAHNEGPGYIVEGPAVEVEEGVAVHNQNYEVII